MVKSATVIYSRVDKSVLTGEVFKPLQEKTVIHSGLLSNTTCTSWADENVLNTHAPVPVKRVGAYSTNQSITLATLG